MLGTIVLLCLTLGGITHTDGTRGAYATGGGEIRHSGVVLSALAPFPAVIDGRLNSVAGEWDAADFVDLAVNVPEGGTVPGRLYEMNDAANLYLSLRLDRRVADPRESLGFEFDNDHDGIRFEQGDDVLFLNPEIPLFYDGFRTLLPPCPPGLNCGISDTDGGGTNDGAGAFGNDGTYSVFEFSHPLDTTDDAHDFSIGPGDTVGVTMDLRLGDGNVFADSELNSADIVIPGGSSEAREVALRVEPETLNLKSEGRWVTARLSVLNATADAVELDSLTLNGVPLAWAHVLNETAILAKFDRAQLEATLAPGHAVEVDLAGLWSDGTPFAAADTIRVIQPGP